jgi:ribosomal protein S20
MPNIKSAKKRLRQSLSAARNRAIKSAIKTQIRKFATLWLRTQTAEAQSDGAKKLTGPPAIT